jgi:hypothetical protein
MPSHFRSTNQEKNLSFSRNLHGALGIVTKIHTYFWVRLASWKSLPRQQSNNNPIYLTNLANCNDCYNIPYILVVCELFGQYLYCRIWDLTLFLTIKEFSLCPQLVPVQILVWGARWWTQKKKKNQNGLIHTCVLTLSLSSFLALCAIAALFSYNKVWQVYINYGSLHFIVTFGTYLSGKNMFQKSIYSASWVVSSQCCSWFMWNVAAKWRLYGKALGEIS